MIFMYDTFFFAVCYKTESIIDKQQPLELIYQFVQQKLKQDIQNHIQKCFGIFIS